MKKMIILTMLLVFAAASFGQQVPVSNPAVMQTEYLKKSKRQKTWAWVTTGLGAYFIAATLFLQTEPILGEDELDKVWAPGYYIGGACIATGIVLFVASSKNAPMLQQTVIRNQSFPAVGVRIHL